MKRFLTTEFTVGTFALLGLLIIVYMSLEVNDRSIVGGKAITYYAYFDSVTGLVKKVPVEVSGIPAGYVANIELNEGRAYLTVRIREDVPVYKNGSLRIRDRGILGDKYLSLSPGTPDQPALQEGDEITNTLSGGDYDKLFSSLGETADLAKQLLKSDNPEGALGQVIINLRDATGKMNSMMGENEARLNRILMHMESFSSDLNDITTENKENITTALVSMADALNSLKESLGEGGSVQTATENFNQTMASLQRITEKIESGEGTIGKLINDETTVNNLNESMENLNDTLGGMNRVQLGVRYRGEYLMGDESLQSLIAVSLAPSPDKFITLEFVDAPTGETTVTNTIVSSDGEVISNTETVQTDDKVLFSVYMGKRLWDLTFRFGLMRNKGGIGFDYHLWQDKIILSTDLFDFGRVNDNLHLRAYGTLVFYKHLLLTGGVDDAATKNGSVNPFFGAGIQFTDHDLKSLLGASAAAF